MKIEYDPGLYSEIASYSVNEIVQVENRKGKRSTIHIKNITKLSWHELQLLIPDGSDRFSKMILLYRKLRIPVNVATQTTGRLPPEPG